MLTCAVVGMKAGGRENVVGWVDRGDPALVVVEPDNPHDPNAVAVYTCPAGALPDADRVDGRWELTDADHRVLRDRQAGYIPADVAARYRPARGGMVAGEITRVRYHDGYPAGFDVRFDAEER